MTVFGLKPDPASPGGPMPKDSWKFDHSYARLPQHFYAALKPEPVSSPRLVKFNYRLAEELGLSTQGLQDGDLAQIFSGNRLSAGMFPLAQAYAGYQFGHFTVLGDGRALLLGEIIDPAGRRFDLQLKGSGRTPFSRDGDGRAALGPMLREYIVSEAMAALGIPTSRSLAVVASGEPVIRQKPLPGAVLTRVAASHIRVGTFEYFAAAGDTASLSILADYTLERHYPAVLQAENKYCAFFQQTARRQAELVAGWMLIGFIHGVMNTDNMSIAGETIDYGPCAFMDEYHPDTVFSSIDRAGRYRFANQPAMARWNLARLAEALLPVLIASGLAENKAVQALNESLEAFPGWFEESRFTGMGRKLGLPDLAGVNREWAGSLIESWLDLLARHRADYTNSHRALADYCDAQERHHPDPLSTLAVAERALFSSPEMAEFLRDREKLIKKGKNRIQVAAGMKAYNPAYIPRNHRIEAVIIKAEAEDDFAPFEELLTVLSNPFQASLPEYSRPPLEHERVRQTFCGT